MTHHTNEQGHLTGQPLPGWPKCPLPGHKAMQGQYARLVSLDAMTHASDLFEAFRQDKFGAVWAYNGIGPFNTMSGLRNWIEGASGNDAQPCFAIIDKEDGKAKGIASFMNIQPEQGVIEIGGTVLAPQLQQTRVATEAFYLMMHRAMRLLGYRRLEWKCDALNTRSRAAAERLGYRFEGISEQDAICKGRNWDTACYSLVDRDWKPVERGFQKWLSPGNFDDAGRPAERLHGLISAQRGPQLSRSSNQSAPLPNQAVNE